MPRAVGLDFGTTNSAIAVVDSDGTAQLATFQADGHAGSTFRSILYFFHPKDDGAGGRHVVAGPEAIPAYREAEPRGRFIQSIKSFLASRLFDQTHLYHRTYQLEDLIAAIVCELRTAAEAQFGELGPDIVVGRPVRFAGASDADDEALALSRLQQAVQQCGFDRVSFEYEPVAAASYYETQLDHDELVLIADFGGGTSDFSLLRLGPSMRAASMRDQGDKRNRILGTAGVAIGGNDFDSQFIRHLVAPALGAGSTYTSFGKTLPMPQQLYAELERWDKLSFLKTRQTLSMLHEIRSQAHEPGKIEALLWVIEEELGYQLYKAIEGIKFTLSTEPAGTFVFHEPPVEIAADVTREAFEAWIRRDLDDMRMCIDQLLEQCHVTPGDIDSIFMTGGTSLVPMVRQLFEDKFSPDRLRSGGELTAVARGLALRALMR